MQRNVLKYSYCVYKITNIKNGKIYIGKTSANTTKRWKDHVRAATNPRAKKQVIHLAIQKYGLDNFIFEIISYHKTEDTAYKKEQALIKQFKSNNSKFGYNQNKGGKVYGVDNRKLTNLQVKRLMKEYATTDLSLLQLSRKYYLSKTTVKSIISRETYLDLKISDKILYEIWLKLHRPKPYNKYVNEDVAKLSAVDIKYIFRDFTSEKYTITEIAQKYNTVISNIEFILNRKTWRHVNIHHKTLNKANSILNRMKNNLPIYDRSILKNQIFEDFFDNNMNKQEISFKYSISADNVTRILNGTVWKNYSLKNKYKTISKRNKISAEKALDILLFYCKNEVTIDHIIEKFDLNREVIRNILLRNTFKSIDLGKYQEILDAKTNIDIPYRKIDKDKYSIIYDMWKNGKTFTEIGKIFNVNRKTISTIICKIQSKSTQL